jgi:hypothetical protein
LLNCLCEISRTYTWGDSHFLLLSERLETVRSSKRAMLWGTAAMPCDTSWFGSSVRFVVAPIVFNFAATSRALKRIKNCVHLTRAGAQSRAFLMLDPKLVPT